MEWGISRRQITALTQETITGKPTLATVKDITKCRKFLSTTYAFKEFKTFIILLKGEISMIWTKTTKLSANKGKLTNCKLKLKI